MILFHDSSCQQYSKSTILKVLCLKYQLLHVWVFNSTCSNLKLFPSQMSTEPVVVWHACLCHLLWLDCSLSSEHTTQTVTPCTTDKHCLECLSSIISYLSTQSPIKIPQVKSAHSRKVLSSGLDDTLFWCENNSEYFKNFSLLNMNVSYDCYTIGTICRLSQSPIWLTELHFIQSLC